MTNQEAIEHLQSARRILEQSHDIEDSGAAGEHPHQKPNWAMRATNAIDEALSEVASICQRCDRRACACFNPEVMEE